MAASPSSSSSSGPSTNSFVLEESSLTTPRGHELHCRHWKPQDDSDVKALLFLSHGYAEHLGLNYGELGEYCGSRGIHAFGHDHVGHGKSSGARVQVESPADYTEDVIYHCQQIKKKYENRERPVKLFIMGHSMGGFIALLTSFTNETLFDGGMILVGPAVQVDPEIATPFNVFLAKVGNYVAPGFQVSGIPVERVTRDEERVRMIKEDPLHWHGGLKLRHSYVLLQALNKIINNFPNIKLPIYIQHGEKDTIVTPKGSQTLFDAASSTDKTIKFYPDAFHHLYIELPETRSQVIQDTYQWIEQRI